MQAAVLFFDTLISCPFFTPYFGACNWTVNGFGRACGEGAAEPAGPGVDGFEFASLLVVRDIGLAAANSLLWPKVGPLSLIGVQEVRGANPHGCTIQHRLQTQEALNQGSLSGRLGCELLRRS